MALQLNTTDSNTKIVAPKSYWRIERLIWDARIGKVRCDLAGYFDAAARVDAHPFTALPFDFPYPPTAQDILTYCYDEIKKDPAFVNAISV